MIMHPGIPMERHQHAHFLLDSLTPDKFDVVLSVLEALAAPNDPFANVPIEAEELNDETIAAMARSRASLAQGEGIPHEEILKEFGMLP